MTTVIDPTETGQRGSAGRVMPLARALAILSAFSPGQRWLGSRDLATRSGLADSTAARLARALVACGYLHHDVEGRRFRLSAAVMALGYGAGINAEARKAARLPMAAFARRNELHVVLCGRERLDLIVLDHCDALSAPDSPRLRSGDRVSIGGSPMGWALLAVLPDLERNYLMESLERRAQREWTQQRRRMGEAIVQVREMGWCSAAAASGEGVTVVAAPLRVADQPPLVLGCLGASPQMTRARIERELGPRLAATATCIQEAWTP